MSNISLQLSSQTINTISSYNPNFTANFGTSIGNALSTIGNYQNAASLDFGNFLWYGTGTYTFTSLTQAIVHTTYATYTVNGSNLYSQTAAAMSAHAGTVNISSMQIVANSGLFSLATTGNINITETSYGISSIGTETSASLTLNNPGNPLLGTQETLTAVGSVGFSNGYVTSGTITSGATTSNGFVASDNVTGSIYVTPYGTGYTFGGTVSSYSEHYSNGDFVNVTGINTAATGQMSFIGLTGGNDILTGSYGPGLSINTGPGNVNIAAGNGSNAIIGGGGSDTVTFRSALNNYTITSLSNGSYSVSSTLTGEGPDTLQNIKYLKFSDATVTLGASGTSVTNLTGQQTTLIAPTSRTTVTGGGHDVLNFLSEASSAITLTANGDGSLTVAAAGVSDHVSGVMQIALADKIITIANSDQANLARLYQAAFGRSPDAGGLAAWESVWSSVPATIKAAGTTTALAMTPEAGVPSIASGFTNSGEFQAKYGSLSNADYLTQIYSNVLGRVADQAGYNAWLSAMNTGGYTKEMILVGFAESGENVTGTTYSASHTSGWLFGV